MQHKLSHLFVKSTDSIKTVLERISSTKIKHTNVPPGVALVVDGDHKLFGIVTNGDIRRAFENGITVEQPISKAMNKNPSVIKQSEQGGDLLSLIFNKMKEGKWPKDRLERILVVDDKHRVVDMVSFYDLVSHSDVRFKHIAVVGLGYVGLTLGLTLADLGFKVKGFDTNKTVADSIRKSKPHFFEQGLDRLLKDHLNKNFRMVDDFEGENNADVYFIAVGTPLDANNKPGLHYLEGAAATIGKILKHGDAVILRSTVPLGSTRNSVIPILEKESGMKAGDDFLVAFAPERTIEGKALEELRRLPQVIGGINRASCDLVASIFNFMSNSTIVVDSLEAAEMVKLVNNTYRDVSFAFANEVALISQQWGIDTKQVIEAANYGYERSRVPMPSPGVGGYCLEKDPFIFIDSAKKKGYEPLLPSSARRVSDMMIDYVADGITSFLKTEKKGAKKSKIALLGFAFKGKPITSDVRGSTTVILTKKLQQAGYKNIHGYDAAARKEDIVMHDVTHVPTLQKAFASADVVVVMNNHPEFETLDIRGFLAKTKKPVLFFDTWSLYDADEVKKVKGVMYRRL
ncbi:MAG: nucleotide sugar dehydrogenase [bacterium]|nr:nucleotide sugar dehydrogenase [bacterium]MDZ4285461.1 nucleotide sugar dehydrogenase [Candidatus Sungbacteria bacterium]